MNILSKSDLDCRDNLSVFQRKDLDEVSTEPLTTDGPIEYYSADTPTYKVKVSTIVRTTSKAVLVEKNQLFSWIPLSVVLAVKHRPGKKKPWKLTIKESFQVNFTKPNNCF